MIVRQFLLWARRAAPGDRAEAVTALANAFMYSDLSVEDRGEAETALTAMLDDGSLLVRRAMAEALCGSSKAPHHLMVALAGDALDVASIVLARSPVLSDGDLVDAAALGEEPMQDAIAGRRSVSVGVAAALSEVASASSLVTLARNPGAQITATSLARIVERHGDDPDVREALLSRPDLPIHIAQSIAAALAQSLGRFVTGCGWLSPERSGRATHEACERATVALASRADRGSATRLVEHLRVSGQLTPILLLRSMLSRNMAFAEAAFADLSELALRRASAILHDGRSRSFRALYDRAGLPAALFPIFEAVRGAAFETGTADDENPHAILSRRVVARALAACEEMPMEEAGRFVALLRRFEVEAARDEARLAADGLAQQAALAMVRSRAVALAIAGPTQVEPHLVTADPGQRFAA